MSADWDVYRDVMGRPVTITEDQARAIWRAVHVWMDVYRHEKGKYPEFGEPNLAKSCLLGRMLFEGRPPLPEAPPLVMSAPAYWLVDPELCPKCRRERTEPGGWLSVSVHDKVRELTQCMEDWHQSRWVPEPYD
jgi:hypothetical protein